jgi:hypothetical protein
MTTPARSAPPQEQTAGDRDGVSPLRAEEFDDLVRDLVPRIRLLLPDLSDTEVLRAAARMAEYRLGGDVTLTNLGPVPRI